MEAQPDMTISINRGGACFSNSTPLPLRVGTLCSVCLHLFTYTRLISGHQAAAGARRDGATGVKAV